MDGRRRACPTWTHRRCYSPRTGASHPTTTSSSTTSRSTPAAQCGTPARADRPTRLRCPSRRCRRTSTGSCWPPPPTAGRSVRCPGLRLAVNDAASGAPLAEFAMSASEETAFVTGEFYRRGGAWKFRAVGQGYASGLAGLATDFGISVGEPTRLPPPHRLRLHRPRHRRRRPVSRPAPPRLRRHRRPTPASRLVPRRHRRHHHPPALPRRSRRPAHRSTSTRDGSAWSRAAGSAWSRPARHR